MLGCEVTSMGNDRSQNRAEMASWSPQAARVRAFCAPLAVHKPDLPAHAEAKLATSSSTYPVGIGVERSVYHQV